MTLLDGIWLGVCVSLGVVTLFTLRLPKVIATATVIVAAALSVAQLVISAPFWQAMPVCLLVLLSGTVLVVFPKHVAALHWPSRLGLRAVLLISLGATGIAWVLPPVPVLPAPTGPYVVGTRIYRLVDESREESATPVDTDKRNVVVQAWYPADPSGVAPQLPYMDGLGRLPDKVSMLPSVFLRDYGRIDTHAMADAAVSSAQQRWPVILFSPGYGAPRFAYTSMLTDLASRGFVVIVVDHPYEVALTELADGQLAVPPHPDVDFTNDNAGATYMSAQQDVRRDDLAFVLDLLEQTGALGPLTDRVDLARIVAAGHSFGGATAAALAEKDSRIRAAINIDGTPYGSLVTAKLPVPYLLIQSDFAETGHSERFLRGNAELLANAAPGSARHELKLSNHYSFTDLPLYFSPPVRGLLSLLIGGSRGVESTLHETNRLISAFIADAVRPRA